MTDSPNCFRNILLATDFSEAAAPALETAIKIARPCRAKLTVVHVVPDAAANYADLDYGDAEAVWAPLPSATTACYDAERAASGVAKIA